MINRIMRLLHKIIVHLLNMCTSCARLTSPIDGFSNLEFCCPYIITSAYYRPKNEEKTGLNYQMMGILRHFIPCDICRMYPYLHFFINQ